MGGEELLKYLHLWLWLEQLRIPNLLGHKSNSSHLLYMYHVPGTMLRFYMRFSLILTTLQCVINMTALFRRGRLMEA